MSENSFGKHVLKFRFGLKARISLYERIAAFLEAEIDIVATLRAIRDRYTQRKDYRAKVLSDWIATMEEGSSFSEAVKWWIPSSEHMLIAAGERGEGLINGLHEATVLSNAAARNKSAIIGGMVFPIALFGMIIGLLIMFQIQMVPIFKSLIPIERWPSSAKTLNSLSYFFYHYLWLVILGMVGFSAFIGMTIGTWTRPPREFFDKLPPWSIYRSYQSSSFLIGLSSLMKAGIANYDALRMMHKNASPWMRMHLERMMSAMKLGGSNPGKALETGLLDQETAGDVQDYSRLGSFQDAIYLLGSRSLEKGIKSIEMKMGIIRNIMLFGVAASIGWVYLTSYGLQSNIATQMSSQK
jgi:type II secretory pathway component PulF